MILVPRLGPAPTCQSLEHPSLAQARCHVKKGLAPACHPLTGSAMARVNYGAPSQQPLEPSAGQSPTHWECSPNSARAEEDPEHYSRQRGDGVRASGKGGTLRGSVWDRRTPREGTAAWFELGSSGRGARAGYRGQQASGSQQYVAGGTGSDRGSSGTRAQHPGLSTPSACPLCREQAGPGSSCTGEIQGLSVRGSSSWGERGSPYHASQRLLPQCAQ